MVDMNWTAEELCIYGCTVSFKKHIMLIKS